jgi:hypothetical protein
MGRAAQRAASRALSGVLLGMTKRLEVQWDDACQVVGAWHDRSAVLSKEGRSLVRVRSVGYVLRLDKQVLVLADSIHGSRVGGVQVIPRGAIVKRKRLR